MFLSVKLRRKIQIYRGKLVQSMKNVFKDHNDRPDVERLMKVVDIDVQQDYQDWNEEGKTSVREFVVMQIKYGRVCCPKERVFKLWKEHQLDVYKSDMDKEASGDFLSLLCLLTLHQIGLERVPTRRAKLKYSCATKYTSDRKSRRAENEESVTAKGMKVYEDLVAWMDKMKESAAYGHIRRLCNVTAKDMNVLPPMKESSKNRHKRLLEAEAENAIEAKKVRVRKGSMVPGMDDDYGKYVVPV
eukprot:scaffold117624_cov43-Cyclotella_meneghiniana.AAC.2